MTDEITWNVGVIGLGNMGAAIANGLLASSKVSAGRLHGFDANAHRTAAFGGQGHGRCAALLDQAEIVIVAVKPHIVPSVLQEIAAHGSTALFVSVAAGVTLDTIEQALPNARGVIRAMPNTAAEVCASTTALVASASTAQADIGRTVALFDAVGTTVVLDREPLMHVATALVGSGPAFVYVMAEALADGAVAAGMPRQLARDAAAGMLAGAAALLAAHDGSPAELKDRVASPGGTTIAGLRALESHGFRDAVIEAVLAASRRSEEIA